MGAEAISNQWAGAETASEEYHGLAVWALVALLSCMMGGLFPAVIILYSQAAVYAIWGLFWIFIIMVGLKVRITSALRPMSPFLLWMAGFVAWGSMAATYPVFDEMYRLVFRFTSVAISLSLVVSSPQRLRMFANGVQWALVGNLLITLFLMQFPQYQGRGLFEKLSIEAEADRFAGLWGNANHAGLVSLLILVLSHWASRWVAVIGRCSGLLIIYLTASRTAFLITGSLFIVHFLFFSTMRERMKMVAVGAVLGLMGFLYIGIAGGGKTLENLSKNPVLARVLDISESNTRQQGQQSRLDLLKRWLPKVAEEPWYGYGLYSMGGSESKEIGFRPGFPDQGTHNLYVGILVDVGWVGLLTFLGTIGYQLWKVARLRMTAGDRRMVFSLAFIVFVFAFANHNMVTDYPGWIAFPLLFHIPAILALPEGRIPAGAASR